MVAIAVVSALAVLLTALWTRRRWWLHETSLIDMLIGRNHAKARPGAKERA